VTYTVRPSSSPAVYGPTPGISFSIATGSTAITPSTSSTGIASAIASGRVAALAAA
jgi:hypothetical protein